MTSPEQDLAVRMAEMARVIALRTVDDVLVDVTAIATELIPGVDAAGVLLVGNGDCHQTLAPTSDLMFKLGELQLNTGEGPCLTAALGEVVVRVDDFRYEPRYPNYAPEAVRLGVLSALSFKLYAADRTAGFESSSLLMREDRSVDHQHVLDEWIAVLSINFGSDPGVEDSQPPRGQPLGVELVVLEGVLHLLSCILQAGRRLVELAFVLSVLIAGHLAEPFLGLPAKVIDLVACLVSSTHRCVLFSLVCGV